MAAGFPDAELVPAELTPSREKGQGHSSPQALMGARLSCHTRAARRLHPRIHGGGHEDRDVPDEIGRCAAGVGDNGGRFTSRRKSASNVISNGREPCRK